MYTPLVQVSGAALLFFLPEYVEPDRIEEVCETIRSIYHPYGNVWVCRVWNAICVDVLQQTSIHPTDQIQEYCQEIPYPSEEIERMYEKIRITILLQAHTTIWYSGYYEFIYCDLDKRH